MIMYEFNIREIESKQGFSVSLLFFAWYFDIYYIFSNTFKMFEESRIIWGLLNGLKVLEISFTSCETISPFSVYSWNRIAAVPFGERGARWIKRVLKTEKCGIFIAAAAVLSFDISGYGVPRARLLYARA